MDCKDFMPAPDDEMEKNDLDDGNIPEEDLPAGNVIPDERSRKDGPGGE